jgi:hypothetical protein
MSSSSKCFGRSHGQVYRFKKLSVVVSRRVAFLGTKVRLIESKRRQS